MNNHTRNGENEKRDMSEEENTEGTRANVVGTPEKIVYDSPKAVLRATLLTDTHNKGK